MISLFVAATMLVVEYLHVLSSGRWRERLIGQRWGQYALAAMLGVLPGCLGVFTSVALYTHGSLSFGAMVTATIASSGDEAFVMLAMFPGQALAIFAGLGTYGLFVGAVVGRVARRRSRGAESACLRIHPEDAVPLISRHDLVAAWRGCTPKRAFLAAMLAAFLAAVLSGVIGPEDSPWIRLTLGLSAAFGLFVVSTVPDHFLEEHLWSHVIRRHVPSVFLWTFGALLAMHLLAPLADWASVLQQNRWALLAVACLVGLLPESGPHLIFVTLFAQGLIPLSVLLASCVVQDGHGMLPMLAYSRTDFLRIKAINLVAGALAGATLMALGH